MVRIGLVVMLAMASSCGKKAEQAGGKPRVAVSIFPLYDLTRRVAGDRAEVLLVLPPGRSEHGYDPTPKEIARLEGARLAITVGLDMDTAIENIVKSAGNAKLLRIGERVQTMPIDVEPISEEEAGHEEHGEHGEKHDDHDDHDHGSAGSGSAGSAGSAAKPEPHDDHDHKVGAPDPHVWLDPQLMISAVNSIAAELVALDPKGVDVYTANLEAVTAALRKLDAAIDARAKAWTKRTIVTFHGSMSYFAKRYGIRIAAVVEPTAGKEPTPKYMAEVIAAIHRGKAAALFTEPQLAKGPGETIAKDAGIPLGELDPVGGTTGRDSYEALLTWNTDQLDKVLR